MAIISKVVCDACGCDLVGSKVTMKLHTENNSVIADIMGYTDDSNDYRDLCENCALEIAKCFNDIVTKSNKNNI